MNEKLVLKGNPLDDDDVIYFYRKVLIPYETNPIKGDWNCAKKSITQYKKRNEIKFKQKPILFCDKNQMRESLRSFNQGEVLLICLNKRYKTPLFFNHIRNAFVHNNIRKDGCRYNVLDIDYFDKNINTPKKKQITMIGSIDCKLLKEIINTFIK